MKNWIIFYAIRPSGRIGSNLTVGHRHLMMMRGRTIFDAMKNAREKMDAMDIDAAILDCKVAHGMFAQMEVK